MEMTTHTAYSSSSPLVIVDKYTMIVRLVVCSLLLLSSSSSWISFADAAAFSLGAVGYTSTSILSIEAITEALSQTTLPSLSKLQETLDVHRLNERQLNYVEQTRKHVAHVATKYSSLRRPKDTDAYAQASKQYLEIHPKEWKEKVIHANATASVASATATSIGTPPPFTCASMPTVYTPYMFCSGVVDYPYYLMTGLTEDDLNQQAKTFGSYFSSYLNTQCLTNVKRYICASIYLPCVPNVVPGDYSTYAPVPSMNMSIPYQRPCKSICTATTYLSPACGGMLEAMGLGAQCDSSLDLYSGGLLPLFVDDSLSLSPSSSLSTTSQCNALSTTIGIPLVAEQKESYIGQVCAGIVSEYSVPPSTSLDPNFSPLLPPYVLQTITEMILSSVEELIPRYLTSDCLVAQRAFVCSSYFLKPESSQALSFLFGEIWLPSFPQRQVCTNYTNECAYLISLVPALQVDCTTVLPDSGIALYPESVQTIATLDFGNGFVIPLMTHPNYLESMTFTLSSQCPYAFAIPEDPTRHGQVLLPGTACAVSCPLKILESSEYEYIYEQSSNALLIAFALTIFQVINLTRMKLAKINIFVLSSIIGTLVYTITQVLQVFIAPSTDSLVCSSETSWYSIHDSSSSYETHQVETSTNFCYATALLGALNNLFAYWILLAMAGEIWLRVAKGVKKVEGFRIYYLYLPALILIGHGLLLAFYGKPDVLVPGGFALYCSWGVNDINLQYYLTGLPFTIYLCFALCLVIHSLYICIVTSLKVQDADRKPLKKIWKSYSMLFLFLALDLIIFPVNIFLVLTKWFFIDSTMYAKGSLDWIACLFIHFTNESDTEYLTTCGHVPSIRIEPSDMIAAFMVTSFLTSIVMSYITLNREVKDFWWNVCISIVIYTGIKQGLSMLPYEWSDSLVDYLRYTTEKSTKKPGAVVAGARKSIVSSSNRTSSTGSKGNNDDDEDSMISSTWKPKGNNHDNRRDGIFLNLARLAKLRTPSMIRYATIGGTGNGGGGKSNIVQVVVAPEHQELFERVENNADPPFGIKKSSEGAGALVLPPILGSSVAIENEVALNLPISNGTDGAPQVAQVMVASMMNTAVAHISNSSVPSVVPSDGVTSSPPAPMLASTNLNQSIAMIEMIRTKTHTHTDISAAVLSLFPSPFNKGNGGTKASATELEDYCEVGNEEPTRRMHVNDDDVSVMSEDDISIHGQEHGDDNRDDDEKLPPV